LARMSSIVNGFELEVLFRQPEKSSPLRNI